MSIRTVPGSVTPVVQLVMDVSEESVSLHIASLILPYALRAPRTRCGGILQTVSGENILYALVLGRYSGKWGFPKGGMEEGETEEECARREVDEELSVVGLSPPLERVVLQGQIYFVFHVPFLPIRPSDTLEILDAQWVSLEQMREMKLNASAVCFLKKMLSVKKVNGKKILGKKILGKRKKSDGM